MQNAQEYHKGNDDMKANEFALAILFLFTTSLLLFADEQKNLADKTLVVWTAPANLTHQGGSVLTLEKEGGVFDAIVFGELSPGKWMAGSDGFSRTQKQQDEYPNETVVPDTFVQIAITYQGKQITIYRNGSLYAQYNADSQQSFGDDSFLLVGLRHIERKKVLEGHYFVGKIDDVRVYDAALSEQQIAALKPNQESDPKPIAWWDFEKGQTEDRMMRFPASVLLGGARVEAGLLCLDKPGAFLMALSEIPQTEKEAVSQETDQKNPDHIARELREHLLADPHRPGYHFVTPEGSCVPFDPNGAIFWKGRYHLFYIFQDERGHNWGHVSSTDLFHWRHHPTGLVSGMFSGNAFINKDGRPTICYHQVGQGNAMAVAVDDMLNAWKKLDSNPITPKTKPGDPHHDKYRSWDPYGWLENDTYYAIFGGERPGVVKSDSLAGPWKYTGDLMANSVDGVNIHEDVSCADFFKLGDKYMLLCISHRLGTRYYLGDWKDEQFHPTYHEMMSWIDHTYFAPESLLDDKGRRIMWAWHLDMPGFKTYTPYGWSGTMALPRVLTLGDDGMLRMNVPKEIESLRYNAKKQTNLTVDEEFVLEGISGNSIELNIEFSSTNARQFGVKVCCSPDGKEQTLIYYDTVDKKLKVDTTSSSLTVGPKVVEAAPFELKPDEPLKLRVFVDKSVVEVFANDGRQAIGRRIYPSRKDSLGVTLFSSGDSSKVPVVEAWEMMPSNPY